MDTRIKDLQKIFGPTPISMESSAQALKTKKVKIILIVTGGLLLLGTAVFAGIKLGKKISDKRSDRQTKKLKEEIAVLKKSTQPIPITSINNFPIPSPINYSSSANSENKSVAENKSSITSAKEDISIETLNAYVKKNREADATSISDKDEEKKS